MSTLLATGDPGDKGEEEADPTDEGENGEEEADPMDEGDEGEEETDPTDGGDKGEEAGPPQIETGEDGYCPLLSHGCAPSREIADICIPDAGPATPP